MDLPHSLRQTLSSLPDIAFGEDRGDYTRRCLKWGEEQGISIVEVVRCVNIKCTAWEVERLLNEIESGSHDSLIKGVTLLLRDRYLP